MHETPFLVPELWNVRYGFESCGEIAGICIDGAEHNTATQRDPAVCLVCEKICTDGSRRCTSSAASQLLGCITYSTYVYALSKRRAADISTFSTHIQFKRL